MYRILIHRRTLNNVYMFTPVMSRKWLRVGKKEKKRKMIEKKGEIT